MQMNCLKRVPTKMSIEGIGTQSGFKNKSSFFLAFQSEFKMTPKEWIEKNC